jgi:glycosyltransferase involved in cell wall biosynthesis
VHYKAPLYRLVAADPRIDFTAIFLSDAGLRPADGGYGRPVVLDRDVASGYRAMFLKRAGRNPTENDEPRFFRYHDWDIVPTLLAGRYDVVWLWGYNYLTHVLAALTQLGCSRPVVLGEDQTLLHGRTPWKAAAKRLALPLLFRHLYGHYVGTQNRRFFEHYGVRRERLFFTPYAVDNRRLQMEDKRLRTERAAIRAEFGIPEDSGPVILFVGRLIPKKQPLFLLEAFRRLVARNNCTLLVVGTGVLEKTMIDEVQAKKVPRVVLAGFLEQSRLPRAYAVADVFVLPSKLHETWGLVVNEAMNFSLPIVVSEKVGSAIDLVIPGANGYVVSADDVTELASVLERLVRDKALRESFGRRSAQIISQWSYEQSAAGLLAAVAAALGSKASEFGF